jgi:hypothetical protein
MATFAPRSGLSEAARITFTAALLLFIATIVIGILNGIDVWEPNHDTLISHVHAGTLGWITLGVSGIAFLMFSRGREVSGAEANKARTLAWAMVGAVTLYVGAFFLGDVLFDDRIQRPIAGTLLFVVVIWFFTWLLGANKAYGAKSPARLGFVLSWISLMIGAVFGVILGLFISNGEVPGLSDVTAARVADAHPPAMLIGYLLLAAFATVEWLLHGEKEWTRAASVQMWLLFVSGIVINIAFVAGKDEELAGPANLLMIIAVIMLLWRSREEMKPAGWRGSGAGAFPRIAALALVGALALLTILISWLITDAIDFDAMTESQEGLILSFDHAMFIGVMTNVLFGVLAAHIASARTALANRVLLWGVNIGFVGFAVGLITTTQALKQTFTPIMGLALLYGIGVYLMELRSQPASSM